MSVHDFEEILLVGGKANSLGRAGEVLAQVLANKQLLDDLYECVKNADAWVRMRAIDTFEKICRQHPDWIEPYIDKIQRELSGDEQQASIKWHIAQIYPQVQLNDRQKHFALKWLARQLATADVDWIVAANCMKALAYFTKQGDFSKSDFARLLTIQKTHKSRAVVKRATKLSQELLP